MAAVALICMTMTCAVFTSCGDDKNDTRTVVYYKYTGVDKMDCLQTTEGLLQYTEFATALGNVLTSIESREVSDQNVIDMTQRVVDSYDNQMIDGTFKLERSYNASDWTTLKTFKVNANDKYKKN